MLLGEGNQIHPTPTSLMTGPAVDAQSPESDCRSAGEHLESRTKEFQLLQPLDLVLTNKMRLVGNGELKGSLGCSDHEVVTA